MATLPAEIASAVQTARLLVDLADRTQALNATTARMNEEINQRSAQLEATGVNVSVWLPSVEECQVGYAKVDGGFKLAAKSPSGGLMLLASASRAVRVDGLLKFNDIVRALLEKTDAMHEQMKKALDGGGST